MNANEWGSLFVCLEKDEFLSLRCCSSFIFPHAQLLYQIRAQKDVNKERTATMSDCCCTFFCFHLMLCSIRANIRERYNFSKEDHPCLYDCFAIYCCTPCAIHQNSLVIHREEYNNGFGIPGGLFMEDYDPFKSNKNTNNNNNNIQTSQI